MKKLLLFLMSLWVGLALSMQDSISPLLNELKDQLEEMHKVLKDMQNPLQEDISLSSLDISLVVRKNKDFLTNTLIPSINIFQEQAVTFFKWLEKYSEISKKDEEGESLEFSELVQSFNNIPLQSVKENIEQLNRLLMQDASKDEIEEIIN